MLKTEFVHSKEVTVFNHLPCSDRFINNILYCGFTSNPSYDEKWLEEAKAKLFKQIDDEKRAMLILPSMRKQMKKIY